MLVPDLIVALREDFLDDKRKPYLWEDDQLLRYLNQAELQACLRAELIKDSTTAEDNDDNPLCSLAVVSTTASYLVSPKIIRVISLKPAALSCTLTQKTVGEMDAQINNWRADSGDLVFFIFGDVERDRLTFYRKPSANDTAALIVARYPLADMTISDTSSPEVPEEHHYDLLDWAAHLAYRKPNSDTFNLPMSQMYEQSFTRKFGPLPTAKQLQRRREVDPNRLIQTPRFGG
jgi:hypothetical protein